MDKHTFNHSICAAGFVDVPSVSLIALTEGLHSREALDLVKEHLLSVMGPTTLSQFSNAAVKMSKFQMAQVRAYLRATSDVLWLACLC